MARFKIQYQKVQKGKVISTAGASVEASTASEARNKFKATHMPSMAYTYKILSVVKA